MAVEKEQKLSELSKPDASGAKVDASSSSLEGKDSPEATIDKPKEAKKRRGPHVSKYLIAFGIIMLVVLVASVIVLTQAQSKLKSVKISNKTDLSGEVNEKLNNTSQELGDAKQNLTISANTEFNNRVLVRGDLDVAGAIKVGGALNLPGITVAGTSTFDSINIAKALTIAGDATVQGQLVVKNGASIGTNLTVNGTVQATKIITDTLEYRQALSLQKPLATTGSIPTISAGGSAGAGGTVAIAGNQVAGSLSINTGAGTTTGLLATITFGQPLSSVPKILISPSSAGAGQTTFYVSRTASGFTVNAATPPPASSSLVFDYFVVQ